MIRLIILIISFGMCATLHANMASPVKHGTLGTRPFVNEYVDVMHEDLHVTLGEDFRQAQFNVKYHINASKNGYQIPFLFYASEYLSDFTVKIDGKNVEVSKIPYNFNWLQGDGIKFKDFSYFFEKDSFTKKSQILIKNDSNSGFYVNLNNMIYFECDISKGQHLIEVNYAAAKWIDKGEWVAVYSFRYALSPAQYWKSFGTLDVMIDTRAFRGALSCNLGKPHKGSFNSQAYWSFDHLPTDVMQITYKPSISQVAQTLIKIQPRRLAYITAIVLVLLHIMWMKAYRKKDQHKKFSNVAIAGGVLIPFLFVMSWICYYDIIDYFVGEHAGRRHGYTFFYILFYPIIAPIYILIIWIIDRGLKRKFAKT